MAVLKWLKRCVPIWVVISAGFCAVFAVLGLIAFNSAPLADFINQFIATPVRVLMSTLTAWIPISLFELLVIAVLPCAVFAVIFAVRDKRSAEERVRTVFSALGIIGFLYCGYVAVMGMPYNATPLAERIGISEDSDITRDELYSVIVAVRDEINALDAEIIRDGGVSHSPYTLDELSEQITKDYETVRVDYPFYFNPASRAKPVMFSGVMSDMGILGIFAYFTGESNVNTEYPDYTLAFTVAHEFAHQRDINRENEANFMAFLVLSRSSDPFLRYSAYLNMYEYLASALYSTDKELYSEVLDGLSVGAVADISASAAITRLHRESPLFKLMKSVNDAYLKSNGTEGVVSYGYVVRLAVSYLNN